MPPFDCDGLADVGRVTYGGIRKNEVWLGGDGQFKQLTADGRSKGKAILSPLRDRIAYYEGCAQGENCIPSVVILNLEGERVQEFQPTISTSGDSGPCASILNIGWMNDDALLGVECHYNPSLSTYLEVEVSSGKNLAAFVGYGFTPSPDAKQVAHVGPILHFAQPFAQSNSLLLNDTTVYPLPKGVKPLIEEESREPIDVVQTKGGTHIGIHQFVPSFAWSPIRKTSHL